MNNRTFSIRKNLVSSIITTSLIIGLATPLLAQSSERIEFASGNDNAYVEDTVTGQQYRDYVLNARAGQTMAVSLTTEGNAYFNILPPGSSGNAIYNGSLNGADTSLQLPQSGDYTVRVYLLGDDRDSNHTVSYGLSMGIL